MFALFICNRYKRKQSAADNNLPATCAFDYTGGLGGNPRQSSRTHQRTSTNVHSHQQWHANERIDLLSDILTCSQTALHKSLKGFLRANEGKGGERAFSVTSLKMEVKSSSIQTIKPTTNHSQARQSAERNSCSNLQRSQQLLLLGFTGEKKGS